MKTNQRSNGARKSTVFVARAQRAFGRVVQKLRVENQKFELPAVVWPIWEITEEKCKKKGLTPFCASSASDGASAASLLKRAPAFPLDKQLPH